MVGIVFGPLSFSSSPSVIGIAKFVGCHVWNTEQSAIIAGCTKETDDSDDYVKEDRVRAYRIVAPLIILGGFVALIIRVCFWHVKGCRFTRISRVEACQRQGASLLPVVVRSYRGSLVF